MEKEIRTRGVPQKKAQVRSRDVLWALEEISLVLRVDDTKLSRGHVNLEHYAVKTSYIEFIQGQLN